MRRLISSMFLIILLAAGSAAAEDLIVNSKDWQDVYSGLQFANHRGMAPKFVTSERHALLIPAELSSNRDYVVIEGRDSFAVGYTNVLGSRGLQASKIEYDTSVNLELAKRLVESGIRSYVIVDDSVGYNAISIAPYAIVSRSYVLFANAVTIDDVVGFLENNPPAKILVYGHVRREVAEALEEFNPEVLNEGNRFDNNRAIVDRYLALNDITQVILSNGEFIEDEIMRGQNPVIFIGHNNIPDETKEFIKSRGFTHAVLIGNELITTATNVKRELGVYVFAKFAKSSAMSVGTLSDLDKFPVPRYGLAIDVEQIRYNMLSGQLEVRYQNLMDTPSYVKATITIPSLGITVGDEDSVFIYGLQEKTVLYEVEIPEDAGDLIASLLVLYGESPGSLEFLLEKNLSLTTISVLDNSELSVDSALYDTTRRSFIITVTNTGETDAFVNIELKDLLIDGEKTTIASDGAVMIASGSTESIRIRQLMTDFDLDDNPEVTVSAYYGSRENALVKYKEKELMLEIKGPINAMTLSIAAAVLLIIILFLLWRRRKDKQPPTYQ